MRASTNATALRALPRLRLELYFGQKRDFSHFDHNGLLIFCGIFFYSGLFD